MAASAGELIVQGIVDSLNAPTEKPCMFYRSRVDAFESRELPAAVVYTAEEAGVAKTRTAMQRTRKINIEFMVQGEPPVESKLDPLYVYAVQTLQTDVGLAAKLRFLFDSRLQWETEASIQDTAIALVQFEATFVTAVNDPTVLIPN